MPGLTFVRSVPLTGSDQVVSAAAAIYRGVTVRETAGAAAVVRIYDNASAASGTLLETIGLAAGACYSVVHPSGVWAEAGIYVDVVSGAIEGSVRVG